jgi:hypothetical protein
MSLLLKNFRQSPVLGICLIFIGMGQAFALDKSSLIRLNQGWTSQQRADYYWGSQGSALMSYDIYLALQDANSNNLINSPEHSDRVGLLIDPPDQKNNPDNLPIGINKTVVPSGQFAGTYMGITCAACHTGQIQYQGKQIRIDGGNGNRFELAAWISTISAALNATLEDPQRFQAMIKRMQKNGAVNPADVKRRLESDAASLNKIVKYQFILPFPPGPGRMDALQLIHNALMALGTGEYSNAYPNVAPVKPPFLWNAPQSAWVQWSGIANNPLKRNFGESLGAFTRHDLTSKSEDQGLFDTTSDIKGVAKLEDTLKRLAPPQWPEQIFGKLDQKKVEHGKKLFAENCVECHTTYPYRWSPPRQQGKRFIENGIVPQKIVGTDATQLNEVSFSPEAVIATGNLAPYFGGKMKVTSAEFNQVIQNKMIVKAVKKAGPFPKEKFMEMNAYTNFSNNPPTKAPEHSYKAAPRDGAWATGPFLHNGSVPNIYELLSPAKERTKKFYVTREFDPVKLGVNIAIGKNPDYLFDTSLKGNSNAGHSFEEGFKGANSDGIIGRALLPDERYALIEYLKSIPSEAGRVTPFGNPVNPLLAEKDKTWFNYKHPFNGQTGNSYENSGWK